MRTAVVGAGILGLRLAHHLARRGVEVDVLEAAPQIGGLVAPHDFGEFSWDRYYHCILPQDQALIAWLGQLGLGNELRWRKAGTGYYSDGRFYSMNGNLDYLKFPLLSLGQKLRLGTAILRAMRMSSPYELYGVTAEEWLTRTCGRECYEVFWRPLLRAKFGPLHDQIAAIFMWATITRIFGVRSAGAHAGHLGYVSGGYRRVLRTVEQVLRGLGGRIHTGVRITRIYEKVEPGQPRTCRILLRQSNGHERIAHYRQVVFTAPSSHLRQLVAPELGGYVDELERDHPTSKHYLGVICCAVVLRRSLMPYYVLNVADPDVELTGVIEKTALVDAGLETAGRTLVYLPRYLPSDSPEFAASESELMTSFLDRGVRRVFRDLQPDDIVTTAMHRAPLVQPLPLPRQGIHEQVPKQASRPSWRAPFMVLNTSMLECATLNNDEVVAMVDEFVARNESAVRDLTVLPSRPADPLRHGDVPGPATLSPRA